MLQDIPTTVRQRMNRHFLMVIWRIVLRLVLPLTGMNHRLLVVGLGWIRMIVVIQLVVESEEDLRLHSTE